MSPPAKKPTATTGRTPRRSPTCLCHVASQSNVWNAVQLGGALEPPPFGFHRDQLAENMDGEVRWDVVPHFAAARLDLFSHCESNLSAWRTSKRSNPRPSPIRDRIYNSGQGATFRHLKALAGDPVKIAHRIPVRAPSGLSRSCQHDRKGWNWWLDLLLSDLQTKKTSIINDVIGLYCPIGNGSNQEAFSLITPNAGDEYEKCPNSATSYTT